MARRRPAAWLAVVGTAMALAGCSSGGREAAPPGPAPDLCTQFNSFQVFNYTAKAGTPVAPDQYEVFYRGLIDGASKLSQTKPELRRTLDIVINGDLAKASGRPIPAPDPGEPSFETADATLMSYQKQFCP